MIPAWYWHTTFIVVYRITYSSTAESIGTRWLRTMCRFACVDLPTRYEHPMHSSSSRSMPLTTENTTYHVPPGSIHCCLSGTPNKWAFPPAKSNLFSGEGVFRDGNRKSWTGPTQSCCRRLRRKSVETTSPLESRDPNGIYRPKELFFFFPQVISSHNPRPRPRLLLFTVFLTGEQRRRCRRGGAGHHPVHQGPHREERAVEQRGGRGHGVRRGGGPDEQRARPRGQQHPDAERFPQAPPLLRPRAKHAPPVSAVRVP